jgi:cytochrome oxidase Cu insertion factor (SCO1/SenC/PrrC family)
VTGTRRWAVLSAAVAAGAAVGVLVAALSSRSSRPAVAATAANVTWRAGTRPAPELQLSDQAGRRLTLRALRGRVVIVSFIDPVCRNLCPLEAKVLTEAVRAAPGPTPALVAVSVNPPADTAANFRADARVWRLPTEWRWGLGTPRALARVWRAYHIGVAVQTKRLAGVTVRNVVHTEAAYVIDARGFERALFLYPFRAVDVEVEIKRLQRG